MKKIIILFCLIFLINVLQAKDENDLLKKVISTSEDMNEATKNETKPKIVGDIIYREIMGLSVNSLNNLRPYVIKEHFKKRENEIKFIKRLNIELKKNDLPTFNLKHVKVIPVFSHGFGQDYLTGYEISDDSYQLCFPCEQGWNDFKFFFKPVTKEKVKIKEKEVISSVVACYNSLQISLDDGPNYNKNLDALIIPQEKNEGKQMIYIFKNPIDSAMIELDTSKSINASSMFLKSFIKLENIASFPSVKVQYMEVKKNYKKFFFTVTKKFEKRAKEKDIQRFKNSGYDKKILKSVEDLLQKDFEKIFGEFMSEPYKKKSYLKIIAPCKGIKYFPLGDKFYQMVKDYDQDNDSGMKQPDAVKGQ